MGEQEEKKSITVFVNHAGQKIGFKIKLDTPLQKVFGSFEKQQGVASGSYYYSVDGERLKGTDTAKMLELEDEDQIDAMTAQMGGRGGRM
jgi:hypothetical protein